MRSASTQPRGTAHDPDLPPGALPALQLLLEAHDRAEAQGRSPWDFAVEIDELVRVRLSHTDLRDLLCRGLVEHARERTPAAATRRSFRAVASLYLPPQTCVVLTAAGLVAARGVRLPDGDARLPNGKPSSEGGRKRRCRRVPRWDAKTRTLRLGKDVVKEFHQPAHCQECVLTAFQKARWARGIPDPLPQTYDHVPSEHRRAIVRNLNHNQARPLVSFRADGAGGIRWCVPGHVDS
jgi:hypothetical protein